jgi:putative peptidoglycan lipid II flippase
VSTQIKHISIVSGLTALSRVLGLIRDSLILAIFGNSLISSAFFLAFTLPNLFRRLLGEGAMTSALIPVLASELHENGKPGAFALLSRVLSRTGVALIGLCALFGLGLIALQWIPGLEERWYLGAELSLYLMPYMPCVCLAALVCAALNLLGHFSMAAMAPIALNLTMIGSLASTLIWKEGSILVHLYILCIGVLFGGVAQFLLPAWSLRREGWRQKIDFTATPRLHEVWCLFLPGAFGAAIFQINTAVSRLLAFGIDNTSLSLLYLANRLVELPMGIFTIAVATVVFPQLAKLAAAQDYYNLMAGFGKGLRLILVITLPAMVGLIILAEPILSLLFDWGTFNAKDVDSIVPVLQICALSIPIYSWSTMSTRGLHSLKDTRSPMKIAFATLIINIVLSVWFMSIWGVEGIAVATGTASLIQALSLQWMFMRQLKGIHFRSTGLLIHLIKLGYALGVMTIVVILSENLFNGFWNDQNKIASCSCLLLTILAAALSYTFACWLLKIQEIQEILDACRKSIKSGSQERA